MLNKRLVFGRHVAAHDSEWTSGVGRDIACQQLTSQLAAANAKVLELDGARENERRLQECLIELQTDAVKLQSDLESR